MDLSQTITRSRGRAAKPLPPVVAMRPLSGEEVRERSEREAGTKAPPLQRLGARHRRIADMLASGATVSEVAAHFGYSVSRISVLKSDPTFQDLLYTKTRELEGERRELHRDHHQSLADLGESAADELYDRLEVDPSQFTNRELAELLTLTSDRTGYGPKRTEEKNYNINFGDRLDAARKRIAENAKTIEAQVVKEIE